MCLENRLTGEAKKKAIAKLPKTFRVWKYCPKGQPEYSGDFEKLRKGKRMRTHSREPKLKAKRWYKARFFRSQRSKLKYKPGFHAFLSKKSVLVDYYYEENLREFEARRADVMEIGKFNMVYRGLKGVVLSHIKPV